ncbi:MAG TPA: DUF2750 domain-containing protein [Tepidisphaeraceae bacterium]|jgi:hypothetical protein
MSWELRDKEFESVIKLGAPARYEYAIKRIADRQEVWSLWENGWVLLGADDGREMVPVWPHARFAAAYAVGDWADREPRAIELSAWIDRWIPGITRDGRAVAVFPTRTADANRGTVVEPEQMLQDLRGELDMVE